MEPMIVAEMETEHYSWLALGRDEAEAREALVATLIAHARQCGNEGSWCFDGMDPDPVAALEYYGARFHEVEPGQGLRDGSPVYTKGR
jgi:hypothetical protein